MILTYELFDKDWREDMNWLEYELNLEHTIESFPMIELIDVTENDFTIEVNTSDNNKKNRIVKAFGKELARDVGLSKFIKFAYNSHRLIKEKK